MAYRIVSLIPSATEILFALRAGERVVGVTHECDHPPATRRLPKVTKDLLPGGLDPRAIHEAVAAGMRDEHTIYALDQRKLGELRPDLIVTQTLCGVCAVAADQVEQAVCSLPNEADVISSDPKDLAGLMTTILEIGEAVGVDTATELVAGLRARLDHVSNSLIRAVRPRVAVLEWPDPPFAPGHWVPEMVQAAGGHNVMGEPGEPSVQVSWDRVLDSEPDIVVLAFCGYDLAGTIRATRALDDLPQWRELAESARVVAIDGSAYASRPGPRLVDGVELLAFLFHRVGEVTPGMAAEWTDGGWEGVTRESVRTHAPYGRTS